MDSELQKQHENMKVYDMIVHLRQLYQEQARHERFEISKALFQARLTEGSPVGPHVLDMIGYVETLGRLGFPLGQELATYLVLQSLPNSYSQFIMSYNMNDYNKPLPELLNMLRTAEHDISKGKSILMVQGTKRKDKGKSKGKRAKGASIMGVLKPKAKVVNDDYCFHKRNCKVYLEELKKKKGSETSTSESIETCEPCLMGKMTKAPFTGKGERASDHLALIHTDVCGPVNKLAREQVPQGVVAQSSAQVTQEPRWSSRIRHEPERYEFLVTQNNDVLLIDNDEPTTYAEAVIGPDSEKWLEAMRSEMEFMYTNQVWTLVDPPEGVKPIGCKWVFKKKTDMDGNVITFKGRLVAKGFRQVHGVDYDETFSPMAMLKSIRILLAIAAYYDYEIWQMDVKTAFLNGKLLENVYMTQPEGFVDPHSAGK
ncbi:hypothetical protein CRG98_026743, partial [Punica granatum]